MAYAVREKYQYKIAPHLLVFLQRAGELVEVLRQFAQFIFTGGRHAGCEIARRQFVRAVHQPFDRGQQTTRQQKGGERRE